MSVPRPFGVPAHETTADVLKEDRQPAVHCFEIEAVDSEHRPSVTPKSRGTHWHSRRARPPRFQAPIILESSRTAAAAGGCDSVPWVRTRSNGHALGARMNRPASGS